MLEGRGIKEKANERESSTIVALGCYERPNEAWTQRLSNPVMGVIYFEGPARPCQKDPTLRKPQGKPTS